MPTGARGGDVHEWGGIGWPLIKHIPEMGRLTEKKDLVWLSEMEISPPCGPSLLRCPIRASGPHGGNAERSKISNLHSQETKQGERKGLGGCTPYKDTP